MATPATKRDTSTEALEDLCPCTHKTISSVRDKQALPADTVSRPTRISSDIVLEDGWNRVPTVLCSRTVGTEFHLGHS